MEFSLVVFKCWLVELDFFLNLSPVTSGAICNLPGPPLSACLLSWSFSFLPLSEDMTIRYTEFKPKFLPRCGPVVIWNTTTLRGLHPEVRVKSYEKLQL